MRYEVELRATDTVIEQVSDLLGDPVVRDCSCMDNLISIDHALPNVARKKRLYRGSPLLKRLGREVAVESNMFGIERSANMSEAEFSRAARA